MNALSILHRFAIEHEGLLSLLGIAAIINMPPPVKSTLYKWLYGTLQSWLGSIRPSPQPDHRPMPVMDPVNPTLPNPKQ